MGPEAPARPPGRPTPAAGPSRPTCPGGRCASAEGPVGGRPHWGKLHGLDAALRGRYPRFDAFVALRDRLDPGGVLGNQHLERVLGPAPQA